MTRSIRRKMICVLAGVLLALAILAGSGVWGLLAYRGLVNDAAVDESGNGSASEIVAAVARLRHVLTPSISSATAASAPETFRHQLDQAWKACLAYRRRLNHLPQALQHQSLTASQLAGEIELRLQDIESQDTTIRDRQDVLRLLHSVSELETVAVELPELPDALRQRVREARATSRSVIATVLAGSVFATILLCWLVSFGYRQVFQPIHDLHQGARRVAQGDFDYRVAISSDDEIGELAESFNLMAERFQEIAHDLDRQVKARSQQLVRSERLASVGFLAAGVAHEINNPLTAICWTGESLESRLSELLHDAPDEQTAIVQQYVRMIQSESARCQEITRKLLDFSRNHETERSPGDVAAIVREVLTLIGHMKKYRSGKLIFEHPDPCIVQINAHEIKQVVLNLIANSLDATGGTGTVRVELIEHVDTVDLRFEDDGCGMDAETIENLFQPFYTTKAPGQGTGLGLSISHRIIADHGGRIEVHSDGPGQGSTFIVHLPRKQPAIRQAPVPV